MLQAVRAEQGGVRLGGEGYVGAQRPSNGEATSLFIAVTFLGGCCPLKRQHGRTWPKKGREHRAALPGLPRRSRACSHVTRRGRKCSCRSRRVWGRPERPPARCCGEPVRGPRTEWPGSALEKAVKWGPGRRTPRPSGANRVGQQSAVTSLVSWDPRGP